MKQVLVILIILAAFSLKAQDRQVYVEITDTVETAYYSYATGWDLGGITFEKDSIGVDSVIIYKFYYWKKNPDYKEGKNYSFEKKYLYEKREYPNGQSSYSNNYIMGNPNYKRKNVED